MTPLVPLVVALPMLTAGVLAAFGHHLPARIDNVVSIGVSVAVTVLCVLLVFKSADKPIDYWFGGWHPRDGVAIGISFHVEPLGAAVAATAGTLMVAAQLLALGYFEDSVPQHYHVLMLVFHASMAGFAISGDIFNLFVWFELMSVAGLTLTGYRVEQPNVLQGAINFGVLNTFAGFLIMTGVALLYGRTGALNLQQLGESLRSRPADGLVVVAFTAIIAGFLVKAGAFPFHFWLADAYSVAPAPVGVLFAGIMSDLGLHGAARVLWEVFGGALAGSHPDAVRGVLLGFGVLTALVGGVMAFLQESLKRMMAFVTIAHVGVSLIGIALLTPRGLAGATVFVVADGLVRGAIFAVIAHVAFELEGVGELQLYGQGRRLPVTGVVMGVGALALAAIPPLGPFLGRGLVTQSAAGLGLPGLSAVIVLATILPAAGLLRAFARIFLGIGAREDPMLIPPPGPAEGEEVEGEEVGEEPSPHRRRRSTRVLLWLPGLGLLVAGIGLAFAPGLATQAVHYATLVEQPHRAALETLRGITTSPAKTGAVHASIATFSYGALSAIGAIALAAATLWRARLPAIVRRGSYALRPLVAGLRTVHDGVIGEYVAWLTFGVAAMGIALAIAIH